MPVTAYGVFGASSFNRDLFGSAADMTLARFGWPSWGLTEPGTTYDTYF